MRLYMWTWTSGKVCLTGYLRSLGLWVKRRRVRECLARLDPQNRALGWGIVVSRRVYRVPWPNSLWHLDRHHSLIHYKLIINGGVEEKGWQVSSLVPQLTIKGLNVFGERCTDAFVTFFTILFMLWNYQGFSMWRIWFSSLYCIPFSSQS